MLRSQTVNTIHDLRTQAGCWATFESHVSRPGYADVLSSTAGSQPTKQSRI